MIATLRDLAMFFSQQNSVVGCGDGGDKHQLLNYSLPRGPSVTYRPKWEQANQTTYHRYYKSILPTPKYIGKGRAIPLFLFHFSCLLFSAATTIPGHFFLLCHPQRGNGAPWPKTIYCVDWPPDTLTDGRCLSRGVVVTTRTHLAENIA